MMQSMVADYDHLDFSTSRHETQRFSIIKSRYQFSFTTTFWRIFSCICSRNLGLMSSFEGLVTCFYAIPSNSFKRWNKSQPEWATNPHPTLQLKMTLYTSSATEGSGSIGIYCYRHMYNHVILFCLYDLVRLTVCIHRPSAGTNLSLSIIHPCSSYWEILDLNTR